VLVSAAFAVILGGLMRGNAPGGAHYSALFEDVSQLKERDDVRAAGVTIGTVDSIEVRDDNLVQVGFEVRRGFPMQSSTVATVKYKNLIGDRILSLSQGPGPASPLPAGGVLPASQTRPA